MKKMMIAALAAVMMSSVAMAQTKENKDCCKQQNGTEKIQQRTDRMVKTYGLNETQAKQLFELNKEYAGKMPMGKPHKFDKQGQNAGKKQADSKQGECCNGEAKAKDKKVNMNEAKEKATGVQKNLQEMQANRLEYDKKLEKIMNSDQFKKYKENAQNRQQRAHKQSGKTKA